MSEFAGPNQNAGGDGSDGSDAARAVVVENHPTMRRAIVEMLTTQLDIEVCGEADRESAALCVIEQTRPDLVIIDLTLEEGDGLDLIERVNSEVPRTKLLVLSMHDEASHAESAIRAGASGYVSKDAPARSLREAVERVLAGQRYISDR